MAGWEWETRKAPREALRINPKDERESKDHEFGIEQDEHAGVIEAPFAAEAARGFAHGPARGEHGQNLPDGRMQCLDAGKAGHAQAHRECAEGEHDGAEERFPLKPEKVRAGKYHSSMVEQALVDAAFNECDNRCNG